MSAGSTTSYDGLIDMPLKDLPVEDFVTLPDYKNIQVEIPTVSEEEIQAELFRTYLMVFPEEKGVTDREVQEGDTANIDYVGKRDGEAFAGGTAEGQNLTIGSHSYIAGFEEGLVGVMPGETVDLNLTFPENYGNAELAGAEVVFTVTVNYIIPAEMDESVFENLGIPGITDLASLRKVLEDSMNEQFSTQIEDSILEKVLEGCTFDNIPSLLIGRYKDNMRATIENNATAYGMTAEDYATNYYGTDLDSLVDQYAEQSLKMNIACQAIANKENLNLPDNLLKDKLAAGAASMGVSVEEYLGESTEEDYRDYLMYMSVLEYLKNVNLSK